MNDIDEMNDVDEQMYEYYCSLAKDPKSIGREMDLYALDYARDRLQEILEFNEMDDVLINNTITMYCDDIEDGHDEPVGLYYITAKNYFNTILQNEIDDIEGRLRILSKEKMGEE